MMTCPFGVGAVHGTVFTRVDRAIFMGIVNFVMNAFADKFIR